MASEWQTSCNWLVIETGEGEDPLPCFGGIMPWGHEVSTKEWFELKKQEDRALEEWSRNRVSKKCKICKSSFYSYEKDEEDPGSCARCGNREGELKL